MKNDINELTEHLFNIDKVSKEYSLETIELLENITNWVTVLLEKLLSEGNSLEHYPMGNAKYPLELFQRVITVSLETMKIVKSLPKLDI